MVDNEIKRYEQVIILDSWFEIFFWLNLLFVLYLFIRMIDEEKRKMKKIG